MHLILNSQYIHCLYWTNTQFPDTEPRATSFAVTSEQAMLCLWRTRSDLMNIDNIFTSAKKPDAIVLYKVSVESALQSASSRQHFITIQPLKCKCFNKVLGVNLFFSFIQIKRSQMWAFKILSCSQKSRSDWIFLKYQQNAYIPAKLAGSTRISVVGP